MEWDNLIDLILNSIKIIGIFITIIIGLIISKAMDLKNEEDNYKFYKEENVYSMIDLIFEGKKCEIF